MADPRNIRWISDVEKGWLARWGRGRKLIVEIGSHLGWSTKALAEACDGEVVAVDDWKGPRDVPGLYGHDYYPEFCENMGDLMRKIRPVRTDHAEFAEQVRQGLYAAADMVFIDGSHEYADAYRDIRAWRGVPGTRLLCGHDLDWPGVFVAVNELLPGAVGVSGTTLWAWGEKQKSS